MGKTKELINQEITEDDCIAYQREYEEWMSAEESENKTDGCQSVQCSQKKSW